MAYANVGVSTLQSGASVFTPTWTVASGSLPRTANDLLVCWVSTNVASPATATGWTAVAISASGNDNGAILYKVATGSDAAPAITASGATTISAVLGEFSGNATTSPLDHSNVVASTTSPLVAANALADAAGGELVVLASDLLYTTGATKTTAHSLNNGAVYVDVGNNDATSTTIHFRFGYGITTGNGAADSDSFTFTTTKISNAAVGIASFKLPAGAPASLLAGLNHIRQPRVANLQRARGRF